MVGAQQGLRDQLVTMVVQAHLAYRALPVLLERMELMVLQGQQGLKE